MAPARSTSIFVVRKGRLLHLAVRKDEMYISSDRNVHTPGTLIIAQIENASSWESARHPESSEGSRVFPLTIITHTTP